MPCEFMMVLDMTASWLFRRTLCVHRFFSAHGSLRKFPCRTSQVCLGHRHVSSRHVNRTGYRTAYSSYRFIPPEHFVSLAGGKPRIDRSSAHPGLIFKAAVLSARMCANQFSALRDFMQVLPVAQRLHFVRAAMCCPLHVTRHTLQLEPNKKWQ